MPAVLVHGVPDTPALWEPARALLARDDIVTPRLPGFGCPVPEGFDATKEAYAAWLEREIESLGEPVDLVGHDWGCLLAVRVASVRPELVRTLAFGSGPIDVGYVWHAMAQLWQTPGAGEEIMEGMVGMPKADLAAGLAASGAPQDLAEVQAEHVDRTMAGCILPLYRSAVEVSVEWQPATESMPRIPALSIWGADDPFVAPVHGRHMAERLGAHHVELEGCGHWWPWERATETAALLSELWG
jgi:pimeloyl-ACP methyl ester carboxylesterase